ncbi:MAG TPA: glycine cleavage system protein GcvH [Patescibacteria group bacterium]|nr:glycine cleavage system protein GcvH [Patescibacteria group bacterium]
MTKILFSDDHEYIRIENGVGTVGISDFAQKALGDVVYVELPKPGATLTKGGQAGVVESVKSASELYSPVSGEVVEINNDLAGDPALVNSDPMGKAWFFKVKIAHENELTGLKDEAAYNEYIKGL